MPNQIIKNKKKLTREELSRIVEGHERIIQQQDHTIKLLDAGLFITIYSLLHEKKIFVPDFIKTSKDITDAGVHKVIAAMMDIIVEVNKEENGKVDKPTSN